MLHRPSPGSHPGPRAVTPSLPLAVLLLAMASTPAWGCEPSPSPAPEDALVTGGGDVPADTATDAPRDATPPRTGHVLGRIVGPDGLGLAAIKVLACTESTCVRGETDASGHYDIDGLLLEPQKMQVFGSPKGYLDFYYFQDVTAENPNTAPRDVVTFPIPDTTSWPTDQGGTVTVAEGSLELTAPAGGFRYPLGAAQEISALRVGAGDLPPLDAEPWVGHAADTRAFVIHPLGVEAVDGAAFRVATVGAGLPPGAAYTAYTVDGKHGRLQQLASLTVGPDGELTMDEAAGLVKLGQLIFVPAP